MLGKLSLHAGMGEFFPSSSSFYLLGFSSFSCSSAAAATSRCSMFCLYILHLLGQFSSVFHLCHDEFRTLKCKDMLGKDTWLHSQLPGAVVR